MMAIMRNRLTPLTCALLLALPVVTGCHAAPRARPVKGGPVDTGAGSLESVRRQLQGSWELVSLEVMAPGGASTTIPATGHLRYDEFGNLTIDGRLTANAGGVDPNVLNMSGRAVIDPAKHMLRFQDVDARTAAEDRPLDTRIDPAKVRYYEFVGDQLKTTTKDANGATTAVATWKRAG
jgi:hypothetical protein